MTTRGDTIRTVAPCQTRQTRALPTAAGRRHWKGNIPTEGHSRNRRRTAAKMRRHTRHMGQEPHSGHLLMRRQCGTPGTASPHRRP